MHVAIIGTGSVGNALARGLSGKGHVLHLGARQPQDGEVLPAEAAREAEVVILALPWAAAEQAIQTLGDLTGKIVIDCMNPVGMVEGTLGLTLGHVTSGGETVQRLLPGAFVVKSLNQVGAEIMARNDHLPQRPAMFMAGDSEAAKAQVAILLRDLGFDPLDAGPLRQARLLEPLAMVWINQALGRGKGRDWALAVTSPATP